MGGLVVFACNRWCYEIFPIEVFVVFGHVGAVRVGDGDVVGELGTSEDKLLSKSGRSAEHFLSRVGAISIVLKAPDLAPIDNRWQPAKTHMRRPAHWDDETLKELMLEGWAATSMYWINRRINSMPLRLQEVIDREGKLSTVEAV